MLCKRCGTPVFDNNLYAIEGTQHIYRCPGCAKPVIVENGIVRRTH